MRIINGKDYYDNALAYGRDENIILVREKNNIMSDDEVGHFNHRIYKPDLTFTIGKIKYIINRENKNRKRIYFFSRPFYME